DCGRSIWRWALWSLLFAVFFAFIYHNVFYLQDHSLFEAKHINEIWSGFSFLYYSVVTFTTLGFGDIIPKSGWLQFWVMLEVTLGYIMLGGLISIFANKLARRS
ncbi:MAG: two pore domain potassium channel family protein, partial [Candidatus Aminicenantes bacterium]|nr:two pore domain potassium channel family protein [Candidatus Aminicenantes bacterium]